MNHVNIRQTLDVAERVQYEGEPLTPDDIEIDGIDDPQEMLQLWRRAGRQAKAAKQVQDACGQQLAHLLGNGGAAAAGDTIVRYKLGRKEHCIDPTGLAAYLDVTIADGKLHVDQIMNVAYAKRSWMDQAVRETFFEWVDDEEPKLTEMPRDRAPAFLQDLLDGEVLIKVTADE